MASYKLYRIRREQRAKRKGAKKELRRGKEKKTSQWIHRSLFWWWNSIRSRLSFVMHSAVRAFHMYRDRWGRENCEQLSIFSLLHLVWMCRQHSNSRDHRAKWKIHQSSIISVFFRALRRVWKSENRVRICIQQSVELRQNSKGKNQSRFWLNTFVPVHQPLSEQQLWLMSQWQTQLCSHNEHFHSMWGSGWYTQHTHSL